MTDNKKQKSPMSRANLRANELVINTLRCIQFYDWLTAYQIAKLILKNDTKKPVHQIKRILKRLVRDKYVDEYILLASGSKNIKAYKIRRRGNFLLEQHHSVIGISRAGINAKSHQYHRFIANEILIEFISGQRLNGEHFYSWGSGSALDNISVDCIFTELQMARSKMVVNIKFGNLPDCAIKDNDENHLLIIEVENSVRNIKNKDSRLRAWLDPFIIQTMHSGNRSMWPDKPNSDNDWTSFLYSTQLFVCSNEEIFRAIYRHVFRIVYENIREDHEIYVEYCELSPELLTNNLIIDAQKRFKSIKKKILNIEDKIFFVVLDGKKSWTSPFQDSNLYAIDDRDDYNRAFKRPSTLLTPPNIFNYRDKQFGEPLGKPLGEP
jgi:hypothetical protein